MPKKQLQLVGVTAMFLASKYEEMYPPEISDFAYVTDRAYTTAQIRDMEMKILRVLKFQLGRPLPLQFLRRASKIFEVSKWLPPFLRTSLFLPWFTVVITNIVFVKIDLINTLGGGIAISIVLVVLSLMYGRLLLKDGREPDLGLHELYIRFT